ncbi:MAG: UbiA family prenyltransferase [Deltaproteobacteria bacterium]|nr:UbiA family prenyltransferase [Deltaproteobacteria bacterium]
MPEPCLKSYLSLARVSNLPTVWTNVLAAVVLARPAGAAAFPFLLLALAHSAFYAAGMSLNDLWDREADRLSKPFRPLPSGAVSPREAGALVIGLFTLGLALLALLPHRAALGPGLLLVAAIVAYDRLHAVHAWSVLLMAGCRLLVFLVCSAGISGTVELAPALGGLAQFAYVLTLSAVARYEKRRDFAFPVIPALIAGISLLDGLLMALAANPLWFVAGLAGACLTWSANRWIRGD